MAMTGENVAKILPIQRIIAGAFSLFLVVLLLLLNVIIGYLLFEALPRVTRYPIDDGFVSEGVCDITGLIAIEPVPDVKAHKHLFEATICYDICMPNYCLRNQTSKIKITAKSLDEAFYFIAKDYYTGKHAMCYTNGMKTTWQLSSWRSTSASALYIFQIMGSILFMLLTNVLIVALICNFGIIAIANTN